MAFPESEYDYIVVGGGQAGCVVASKLAHALPEARIALIETGSDAHENPTVQSSLGAPFLHGTDVHWNDTTASQPGAFDRQIGHSGGRMLSGSSGVNYGMWVRGHEVDFNTWAKHVGDERWSYKGLLPFFRQTETHYLAEEECTNPSEHGFNGPIHTVTAPDYPLTSTLLEAMVETGHRSLADANSGQPLGIGRYTSNWRKVAGNYVRQPAGQAYDLSKVQVLVNTTVHRVVLEKGHNRVRAVGVEIDGGRRLSASKEVIVSCGALRTPQVLMLSGIGNSSHLQSMGIEPLVDLPEVGANMHDHAGLVIYWKLKHPENALALGHPEFDPKGLAPSDWILTTTVPADTLSQALRKDGVANAASHPNITSPRAHYELLFGYYQAGVEPGILPTDGSVMLSGICSFLPTSRGRITLRSTAIKDAPIIDPQYLTTEHDLCVLREAIRAMFRIMQSKAAQREIEGAFEVLAGGISADSSDDELNDWIRKSCITWYHPAGTAAMGTVVDTECRLKGVEGLRVVDASILPLPLAAHYQSPIYAIAQSAAGLIVQAAQR